MMSVDWQATHDAEKKLRSIIEQSLDGIILADEQGAVVEWNRGWEQITGLKRAEVLGQPLWDVQFRLAPEEKRSPARYEQIKAGMLEFHRTGQAPWLNRLLEGELQRPDGTRRTIEQLVFPIKTDAGFMSCAIIRDITERKQAEQHMLHLTQVLRAVRDINQLITREHNPDRLLSQACEILVEARGYRLAWVGLIEEGHKRVIPTASAGQGTDYLDEITITWDEAETGQGPSGTAIRTRQPCVASDVASDPRLAPWRESAQARDIESLVAVPMVHGERVFGVLVVCAAEPGFFDDEEEVSLLAELATDLAFGLQSIEDERERARAEGAEHEQRALAEALADTAAAINSTLNPDEVLERILVNAGHVVPHDGANIMLVESGVARVVRCRGYYTEHKITESVLALHFSVADAPTLRTMSASGQPLIIPDTQAYPDWVDAPATRWIRSYVGAPICLEGQVIGFLNLDSVTPGFFTADHAERLRAFADQAAVAIRNAQLYKAEQERRRVAETLRKSAAVLNSSLDLGEVLDLILQQLREVIAYDSASIQQIEDDHLVIAAGQGFKRPDKVVGLKFPVEPKFPNMRVVTEKKPLVIDDVTQDYPHFHDEARTYKSGHIRSWLGVPLLVKDHLIGMIALDRTEVQPYTAEDVELATAFANQAAIAVENARLYQSARWRAARLALINSIGQQTTAILDLDELLHQAVGLIGETFGYYSVVILLVEGDEIVLQAATLPSLQALKGDLRLRIGSGGITGWVAGSGEPLLVPDVRHDARYTHTVAEEMVTASELAVPIKLKGVVIGVLDVESEELDAFSQADLSTLQTVADQLAIAIENAQLHQAARERATRLELVGGVGRRTTAILELDELLHQAVELVGETFGYYYVNVLLVEDDELVLKAVTLPAVRPLEGQTRLRIGAEGITGWVAGKGEPLLVPDVSQDSRYTALSEAEQATKSELAVPIKLRGKVIGVLNAESDRLDAFSQIDVSTLQAVADQLAVAIENARLFEDAQREIAERVRAEEELRESEEKYRSLVENSLQGLAVIQDGRFVFVNSVLAKMLDIPIDVMPSFSPDEIQAAIHPDDREMVWGRLQARLEGEAVPPRYEYRTVRPDGSLQWFEIFASRIQYQGKPAGQIAFIDITERKQAEEALRDSEERYRTLFESSPETVTLVGLDGKIIDCNAAAGALAEKPKEELIGKPFTELGVLFEEDVSQYEAIFSRLLNGEDVQPLEMRITTGGGDRRWLEVYPAPLKKDNKVWAIQVIGRDVTKRKRAEGELQESEEKYRVLVEHSLQGLLVVQESSVVFANSTLAEISGYTVEELLSLSASEMKAMAHPEDQARVWERLQARLAGKPVPGRPEEFRIIRKDGAVRWLETSASPIQYRGKPAVQAAVIDITERKRAEEELQESEEKYRTLVERSNDGIVIIQDNTIQYANPRLAEIWGGTAEEMIGTPLVDYIHPDEHPKLADRYRRRMAGETVPAVYETVLKRKDGSDFHTELNAGLITYQGRSADLVMVHDITERVRAEEELRESEEKYRTLVEQSLQGQVVFQDFRVVLANPALAKITGYTVEELLSLSADELRATIHPEDQAGLQVFSQGRLATEAEPRRYELRTIRKDGAVRWLETFAGIIQYQGKPAVQATFVDITERKQAEQALRDSEARFRTVFEGAAIGMALTDLEGRVIESNAALQEMHGYSGEELRSMVFTEFTHPDDVAEDMALYKELVAGKRDHYQIEKRYIRKDGRLVWGHLTVSLVRDAEGKPQFSIAMVEDITERVQAGEKLRESEEKYRSLVEQSLQGLIVIQDYRIVFANDAFARISGGYTIEEALSLPPEKVQALVHPEDQELVWGRMRDRLAGKAVPPRYEFRGIGKDGVVRWLELSSARIEYQGKPAVQVALVEVTERVLAEELLRAQHDLSLALSAAAGLDEALRLCVEAAIRASGMDCGGLYLVDETSGQLDLAFATGLSQDFVESVSHYDADSPNARLVMADTPVYTRHQEAGLPLDGREHHEELRAFAIVPVHHEGRVIACLNIASRALDEVPAPARNALEAIAAQIGNTVARLKARDALERRNRTLQTLHEVALDIGTQMDLEGVLRRTVEQAEKLLGATYGGAIYLYAPDEDVLRLAIGLGASEALVGATLKPGEGIAGRVLQTGKPLAVDNYETWEGRAEIFAGVEWGAELGVPLLWQGQVIGVLILSRGPGRPAFTDDDVWLAEMLAAQVAVTIRNAQLFDEIQRSARDLGFLFDVTSAAVSASDLEQALQRVAETLHLETMAADAVVIWLIDPDGTRLVPHAAVGYGPERAEKMEAVSIGQGLAGWVAQHGKPVLVPDVTEDTRYVPLHAGTRSEMSLPLTLGDYIIGVLDVHSARPNAFSEDNLRLFGTMASTVTTVIQSARLFEQVRRRNQALGVLVRMAREMVAAEDVDRLLEGAARALHEDMGYHYASMHLVDAEAGLVRLAAQAGPESSEMVDGFTQRIGVGLVGLAAEQGELIASKDAANDPRALHMPGFQVGSEVSVPLVSRGQVLGVLNVHAKQPNGFDESDMHFLETLAGQLGATLSRARRAEQLREAYQALQEADRLKEEMLQNVSHELRTPLTYITGYTDLLLEGEMGELNADQREGLQIVSAKAEALARLVNDIVTLQAVEGGDLRHERFELPDLLREAVTSSEIIARTAGVELVLEVAPGLPEVRADRLRIGQVLDNLLENAIKFSPDGGQVTVHARMEGAEVCVAVSDTGVGIPPAELERIFERFYQVSAGPSRRFGGVGLGLSICKAIVEAHGGRIWAESTSGQGSTFTFTLPMEE